MESDGEWVYISSGKVEGYVKEEYLLSGFGAEQKAKEMAKTVAVSSADALNIREEPNTDAEIVTQVAQGEELEIAEVMENGWIKVYLDDEEVYVSADYVDVKSDLAIAVTMTELLYGQGVSDVRVDLCQYAKQFLGNPYVWGGESFQDVLTRTADFYQSLIKNEAYRDANILISTHGAASRCLLANFYEDKEDIWRGGVPKNCSVCIADVVDGVGTLVEKDKIYYTE